MKTKLEKNKKITHILYSVPPPPPVYYTDSGFDNDHSEDRQSAAAQLSNSLRLKITRTDVDVNAVINSNRKQAHQSHTPHYEKNIEFFFCKIIFNNK
jgi:hypothetical protein